MPSTKSIIASSKLLALESALSIYLVDCKKLNIPRIPGINISLIFLGKSSFAASDVAIFPIISITLSTLANAPSKSSKSISLSFKADKSVIIVLITLTTSLAACLSFGSVISTV